MLLIDSLLIGLIAAVVFKEKTAIAEQAELIPVPVSDKEKAQKTNN